MSESMPARTRPMRRAVLVLGAVILLGTVGIAILFQVLTSQASASVPPLQYVPGSFSVVDVRAEASDVTVGYGDVDEPEIRFDQGHDARSYDLEARTGADGVLSVALRQQSSGWWSFGWLGITRPHLRVTLPQDLATHPSLTLDSAAGNVRVTGDFDELLATIQAGDLTLEGSAEDLVVESDAGSITALDYRVPGHVRIDGNAGNTDIRFAALPDTIEIDATAGDIDVRLPRGEYQLITEVDLGHVDVGAENTPGAQRRYTFDSVAGSITIAD